MREKAGGGSPFVGREADLSQSVSAFERCQEDKTPILVTVTGAPGIGKTRLRREAISRIGAHASAPRTVLVRAESFAKSHALGVMADVARGLAGVAKGNAVEAALAATDELLSKLPGTVAPGTRDLVARFVANEPLPATVDARAARDALWLALTDIALQVAHDAPLVIALEDAQWADLESLAWLDHLLARAAGRSVFVLATARPTLWRDDAARFSGRDHVRIELRPLARRTVRAIAKAILGDKASTAEGDALVETIAAQANGSPLFAEELARLAAAGRDAASAPTIEAAIQVSLDALEEDSRDAAMKLSVFGMQLWADGLAALGVKNAEATMRALTAAEILVEHANSKFKETREWAFKHALTRDVAYASLGDDTLKDLPREGRAVAREDGRGRRDGRAPSRARWAKPCSPRTISRRPRGARWRRTALGDAVSLAEKSLAFAEDKPTQFAPRPDPRRSLVPPRRASGRARHRGKGAPRRGVRRGERGARDGRTRSLRGCLWRWSRHEPVPPRGDSTRAERRALRRRGALRGRARDAFTRSLASSTKRLSVRSSSSSSRRSTAFPRRR